jgi:hypothetical protein
MKLAITRLVLWFLTAIVVFQTLLFALSHDGVWGSSVSLAAALGLLLLVYTKALRHFRFGMSPGSEDSTHA